MGTFLFKKKQELGYGFNAWSYTMWSQFQIWLEGVEHKNLKKYIILHSFILCTFAPTNFVLAHV
jgi:hypothetical protein